MQRTSLARIAAVATLCLAGCGASPPPSPTPAGAEGTPAASATVTTAAPEASGAPVASASPSSAPTSTPAAVPLSESFLPLVDGARYDYNAKFKGRKINTTVLLKQLPGTKDLFYFVDEEDKDKQNPLISSSNIGEGVYSVRADGIYTGVATFFEHTSKVQKNSMQLLLATPPKVHAKTTVMIDPRQNWTREHVVTAIETVKVPAGTFNGCVHLSITSKADDDDGAETSQAWLAPGVGLVRWERASGRVDELASFEIPH